MDIMQGLSKFFVMDLLPVSPYHIDFTETTATKNITSSHVLSSNYIEEGSDLGAEVRKRLRLSGRDTPAHVVALRNANLKFPYLMWTLSYRKPKFDHT